MPSDFVMLYVQLLTGTARHSAVCAAQRAQCMCADVVLSARPLPAEVTLNKLKRT